MRVPNCLSARRGFFICAVIAVSLLLISPENARSQCIADFTADQTTICEDGQVTFTDLSQGAISWTWYFTNGNPSVWQGQTPPPVTYTQIGWHDVRLEITCPNAGQSTELKPQYIHVIPCPCLADFVADQTSGAAPLTVIFTDMSQNAVSWNWTFPGGDPPIAQGPGPHQVTYNQVGNYNVRLDINCPNATDYLVMDDFINVLETVFPFEYGDAPEGALAYPNLGVTGNFPTCKDVGPNGYVLHGTLGTMYWGRDIDYELDGNGGSCPTFGGDYDNDEGLNDVRMDVVTFNDVGIKRPHIYTIEGDPGEEYIHRPSILEYYSVLGEPATPVEWGRGGLDIWYNVGATDAYVNILFDWNQDGEWGGTMPVPGAGEDAREHAVRNFLIPAGSGSDYLAELDPPEFMIPRTMGYVWARFTISDSEVPNDWDGSGTFSDGETEDYLICVSKEGFYDFGDAPEGEMAYPSTGTTGYFPTCMAYALRDYIRHTDDYPETLCNLGTMVDYELDGNANFCPDFLLQYDKDEGYYNPSMIDKLRDAGLRSIVPYTILGTTGFEFVSPLSADPELNASLGGACQMAAWGSSLDLYIEVSGAEDPDIDVYLNVLADWNQDGEWGGTVHCSHAGVDVDEHILQNFHITERHFGLLSELAPPDFRIGSQSGYVWVRMTISKHAIALPWTGDGIFLDGETEDYLLRVSNYMHLFDYGDAMSAYPTYHRSIGALHTYAAGFCLGDTVDTEPDGRASPDGEGDDNDGADDEDGVELPAQFVPGQQANIRVTASTVGILNAWIDYDRDGSWEDASDHIAFDRQMGAGQNSLNILVPATAAPGMTFARFRFSDTGGLSFDGPSYFGDPEDDQDGLPPIGEVEDYVVYIIPAADSLFDFGDAPDPTYPTLNANFGAYHAIDSTIYMGSLIDDETDGQPLISALGDDNNNLDDEDGVQFVNTWEPGGTGDMTITLHGDGYLNLWVDLNDDGDWADAAEHMLNDSALTQGTYNITVSIPDTASFDSTYARFRYSTVINLGVQGYAPDGEVEDYLIVGKTTRVEQKTGDILRPESVRLSQNYPNPFNPSTKINYTLKEPSHVRLVIFNIAGRQVRKLVDERKQPGTHLVHWDALDDDGRRVPAGVYFYHIQAGEFRDTRKLILLK